MTAFPTKLQQIEEGEEMKEKKAEEDSGMESRADESKYNIFCICYVFLFCFCSRKKEIQLTCCTWINSETKPSS